MYLSLYRNSVFIYAFYDTKAQKGKVMYSNIVKPTNIHVIIEAFGREFNYGLATQEKFPIEMRIPLYVA